MQQKRMYSQGFTLVELAIVLVIIGLLTGGVLVGQNLIRSAELNSIVTEEEKYTSALHTFRDKYFGLPGDITNAYSYWGNTCGTDTDTASTGCNGNGDGLINYDTAGESVKAWEHLYRAGLIEGKYDGSGAVTGGAVALTESNVPKAKFGNGYWNLSNSTCEGCGNNPSVSSTGKELMLSVGALYAAGDPGWLYPQGFTLTNAEAYSIDKKIDDGRSYTGMMRSSTANSFCGDSSYVGASAGDYYDLSGTGGPDRISECVPTFMLNY